MAIQVTRAMALKSLRPNLNSYSQYGLVTEQQIELERARLDKSANDADKKVLRRQAHPADLNSLAELVEELTNRVLALEGRKNG